MLSVARRLAPNVDWRLARAEQLPIDSGRCAAVGSQFGLMFFEDRARALSEMWRVLAPGGQLAVAVWGALDDAPGYAALVELIQASFGERIADELRAPFCLGEPSTLRQLFTDAEIPEPTIETAFGTARFSSIDAWVTTEIRGWTLGERIDDEQLARLIHQAPRALARFTLSHGRVEFSSCAHIVSARKR